MIKYRVGDLLVATFAEDSLVVVAHCCNCFNTMKSGIAPLIAQAFPEAHQADQDTRKGDLDKLGTFTSAVNGEHNVLVYNLYGQYGYWNRRKGLMDLQYPALDQSLRAMAENLLARCCLVGANYRDVKVFLPKIGAGLAGGDWNVIEPMIQKHLGIFDVTIFTLE